MAGSEHSEQGGTELGRQRKRLAGYYKALGSSFRISILQELRKAEAGQDEEFSGLSPNKLKDTFGVSVNGVSYHFRALLKAGLVEERPGRPVRGAYEHFYRIKPELREWVDARLIEFA